MPVTLRLITFFVHKQPERSFADLLDRAVETAALRKRETIDRAVSADARNAAEQGVASDLSGDETCVELEDDFVPRDLAQIIGIGQFPIENAQFPGAETKAREKPRASGRDRN